MPVRTLRVMLRARLAPPVGPYSVVRTPFRVGPGDLDVYGHMNNGVYLSVLDLGRADLIARSGTLPHLVRRRWYPVVAGQTITYRASLKLLRAFEVRTRLLGVDGRDVFVEQRFVVADQVHARAFVRLRFLGRGGAVDGEQLCAELGVAPRPAPEALVEWARATALPSRARPAPDDWAALAV